MALQFTDGFDEYTAVGDLYQRRWVNSAPTAEVEFSSSLGRYGGGCITLLDAATTGWLRRQILPEADASASNTMCVAFAFKTAAATTPSAVNVLGGIYTFDRGNDTPGGTNFAGFTMYINTDGTFGMGYYGDNTPSVAHSTSTSVCDTNWHWIEIAVKNANSGGIVSVYLDGVQEINFSGDTFVSSGSATDPVNGIVFEANSTQDTTYYIDDIICYDDETAVTTGDLTYTASYPIGDSRIETIVPNGAGTNSGWTASAGVNYTCVDESPHTNDTDYVSSTAAAQTDTYAFGNLAGTISTCHAVHVNTYLKADGPGTADVKAVALSSGSTTEGATITARTAYRLDQTNIPLDPNTSSAWTTAGINAAEFGVDSQ